MTHNEQVLNLSLDNWKMAPYLEEHPAPFEPVAAAFEDAEQEIVSYVNDYITEHNCMPEIDDVADRFGIVADTDYEALEKYLERERKCTDWNVPSLR